ncbi:MAG: NADH-quinone oxidoreductase subunit J [Planctomycetota bacterium]|nr:NADH-quinone oxidoreductase subunit J [Planctomycetota bacterium]
MLGTFLSSQSPLLEAIPLADEMIEPTVILALCVLAGVGTLLLLPSRRQAVKRRLGGTLLTAAILILVALIVHATAGQDHSGTGLYFWIFSAIAIFGAIRVVTHPRPVYSALYFVLTVFASAGLFILMYAEFMAAALVLIYAGAILVTYVFVIMLAASAQSDSTSPMAGLGEYDVVSREPFAASCIGFACMGVLLFLIFDRAQPTIPFSPPAPVNSIATAVGDEAVHGSTQALGNYLFGSQLVNLEIAGLILTVAMVGAIVIARRRVLTEDDAFEPSSETITATMSPVDDDPRSIPVYGTTNPSQKAFPEK